jgi:hypothetical protein
MAWVLFVAAGQETLGVFELQDQDILVRIVLKMTVAVSASVAKYKTQNPKLKKYIPYETVPMQDSNSNSSHPQILHA